MAASPSSTPRLTEYVVGYRCWAIRYEETGTVLGSLVAYYSWTPGTNVADCRYHAGAHGSGGAYQSCECGLYAYHGRLRSPRLGLSVVGAIRAWGRIQVYADGFRAEYAEIVALALNPVWNDRGRTSALDLLTSYGVPIVNETDLPVVAAEYGSPVPKNLRPPHPSLR